jgi:hypothetical protein
MLRVKGYLFRFADVFLNTRLYVPQKKEIIFRKIGQRREF